MESRISGMAGRLCMRSGAHGLRKGKEMQRDKKVTGWKIPLLFCAAILAIVAVFSLFLPAKPKIPELPTELLRKAESAHIDLEKSGHMAWREKIRDAAAGFKPDEVKDAQLAQIAANALDQNLPEAAVAAVIHIKGEEARESALAAIHAKTIENCASLEWTVFAIHASSRQVNMNEWSRKLLDKWQSCKGGRTLQGLE